MKTKSTIHVLLEDFYIITPSLIWYDHLVMSAGLSSQHHHLCEFIYWVHFLS